MNKANISFIFNITSLALYGCVTEQLLVDFKRPILMGIKLAEMEIPLSSI